MNRRKGFLLLWVQMASAMLLLLLGGVLALMASAERSAFHAEETADMTLLAEEAMELMKSDPSAGLLPVIPTGRNGTAAATPSKPVGRSPTPQGFPARLRS